MNEHNDLYSITDLPADRPCSEVYPDRATYSEGGSEVSYSRSAGVRDISSVYS